MIKCKDCHYRKDNTCLRARVTEGPNKGDPIILYSKNKFRPDEVVIKTSPRWCPLKKVR